MIPIFYSDTQQNMAKDIRPALQCAPTLASSHKGDEMVSLISGTSKKKRKRIMLTWTKELLRLH